MEIRPLTEDYAVSPQIDPADLPAIAAAGYSTVICNRPDAEIPPRLHAARMADAAREAGLEFVENPVVSGALTAENVATQARAIAAAAGPVLAYCASGNRSSIVWALSQAGHRPVDELIGLPARHGYRLEGLRAKLESLAGGKD